MSKSTRIVLDAMGGDFAPQAVVEGAVQACRELPVEIILVGRQQAIKNELNKYQTSFLPIRIMHATEVVSMSDNPLDVIRKKKFSSIRIGLELVRDNSADAFVSAGNSGAVVSGALFTLKRIKGIDRPAIATIMPTLSGHMVVSDVGANNSCKPFNLVQFAIMSAVYSKYTLHCTKPRVAVLSNGEEETKGTELVRMANDLLKQSSLHYTGYIEGRDIFKGGVDVVVCDGFTGNVMLKVAEGVAQSLSAAMKQEFKRSILASIGYLLARSSMGQLKQRFDYSEYGAAPLLGVASPVMIAHGSSKARAVKNAVRAAMQFANSRVIYHIQNDLEINKDLHTIGKKPSLIGRMLRYSLKEKDTPTDLPH